MSGGLQCVTGPRLTLFLRGAGGTLASNLGEGVLRRVASVRLVRAAGKRKEGFGPRPLLSPWGPQVFGQILPSRGWGPWSRDLGPGNALYGKDKAHECRPPAGDVQTGRTHDEPAKVLID